MTAQLETHKDLVLTYQGTLLKRAEQFKYPGLMYKGYPRIVKMIDARMVKSKQVWKVLQGKLLSFGWRNRSARIDFFESYVRSVLIYGCCMWGLTKLYGRGRVGVDCTGELGAFYRSFLRLILNVGHTIKNSILYVLAGKAHYLVI